LVDDDRNQKNLSKSKIKQRTTKNRDQCDRARRSVTPVIIRIRKQHGTILLVSDARRAGSQLLVNLHIAVAEALTAFELNQLEEEIVAALKAGREDVKVVQVRFEVVSEKDGG
jgi:divalent metal cation (Fe/Co/Zn/Cd) transporter